MMNFINSIPENLGWCIVGALALLCLQFIGLLIRYGIDYIRDLRADETCEEE